MCNIKFDTILAKLKEFRKFLIFVLSRRTFIF